ncbi:hypothetical protein TPHA_0D04530 [Tetrapisispora phaffii CBS 4417]|uniref:Uncharacterized protein n=1 Tax=Tetrapisispora phaffii (strain ATCC 24235 / CBS 4417 / NBRC 1672 / NRRL Y-8282 / UCD 70-5) TaxID=1071381 RepID=G8BS12_TETPH|nr:hypothetical protein TPHA_0D04530 [Tetrapisispora phaffii CBS 4417]CCE63087.1 hypothetical protein TPHA_0D04530 [Tetrapisispora phaffii CBS 4417]
MVTIENAHSDIIHDTSFDYYATRLASCSSDKTIKIFAVNGEQYALLDTLVGHEGPVWRVSWAHPKFGNLLASASYDGKIIIWKEANKKWSKLASLSVHSASVNVVEWAPSEFGAILLAGSSDGNISVVELKDEKLGKPMIMKAHKVGVSTVSWAPFVASESSEEDHTHSLRFVSGGLDNAVKIWKYDTEKETYVIETELEGHTNCVNDVAWSPTVLVNTYIATASNDNTSIVWTQEGSKGEWKKQLLTEPFEAAPSRVNWSLSGNILAVSTNDDKVTLWKENLDGKWETAGDLE